jgi:DNA ligase-1
MFDKRKELGSFENINDVDNETFFKPMLANKLEDYVDDLEYPVYGQPKLDGIRCNVEGKGMQSRNGKKIISAPHIFNDLKQLLDANPDLIFDGELYCDKLANDFNKIISLVRKSKPTKADLNESKEIIQYHIYDLPSADGKFSKRFEELKKLKLPKSCVIVDTYLIHSREEMRAKYEECMEKGYEGQMIRIDAPYQNKRSKYLLKDKEFMDDEFIIRGVLEGKGNLSGKVGKLQFTTNEGVDFEASINTSWEELTELWINRQSLIGKSATVKYFNKTTDGSLRFPKVINIDRESYE